MSAADRAAFDAVAGDLLADLGYEADAPGTRGAKLASYRAKRAAWRAVGAVTQRSPLWRRRHAPLQ